GAGISASVARPRESKKTLVMGNSSWSQSGHFGVLVARVYQSGIKSQRSFFLVGLVLQNQFVLADLHHGVIHAAKRNAVADAPALERFFFRRIGEIRQVAIHAAE